MSITASLRTTLRVWFTERGHTFRSETDSEVLAHLIKNLRPNARQVATEQQWSSLVITQPGDIDTGCFCININRRSLTNCRVTAYYDRYDVAAALRQALSCGRRLCHMVLHQADHDTFIAARKDAL